MADQVVHVLLTDYGQYGWGITSPQLPELIGGRDSYQEIRDDLKDIVAFGGAPEGAQVVVHRQMYVVVPGSDEACIVRFANDEYEFDRFEAGMRLTGVLKDAGQRAQIMAGPKLATGERLFICAVPSDTVRWLSEQLLPGEVASLVTSFADEWLGGGKPIIEMPFGYALKRSDGDWSSLSDAGLTEDSTLADMLMARDSGKISQDVPLVAC
ncbi:hypothetical protein ACIQU3_30890 [Streptomyces sp. NPDC101110]|uniref:hypothetical protein n=1 Tax=Streptomyces sp. NPDC101110 TaxID=3366104 RepID=UPI0038165DF5